MAEAIRHLGRGLLRLYPLALALLAWEAIAVFGGMKPLLFPRLAPIGGEFMHLLLSGEVALHLQSTLYRTLAGFALAAALGIPAGFAMSRYPTLNMLFEPVFAVTYPIPRISLYPIFILVFGLGHLSKISLVTLECLYPIVINTFYGTRAINPRYLWAAQNMGAGPLQMLFKVALPAASPFIFSGLRIALPVALVLAVLTEMISSADGIGFLISYASASFETDRMFAALVYAGLAGCFLDRALVWTRRHLVFWEGEGLM